MAEGEPGEDRGSVLVVDDSDSFLGAAASVVAATSGLRLVGTVLSGEEALRLLPELTPDLVLLDLYMPEKDGIETARSILRRSPSTVVVLMSAEPARLADAAGAAGVAAFLEKGDLRPRILDELWSKHRPVA